MLAEEGLGPRRLTLFGGPVLGADDPQYRGLAQVPREHWKVILHRLEDELRFHCFVLAQQIDPDLLSATGYLDDFDTYAVSIADLETRTGLTFPGLGAQAGVRDGLAAPGPVLVTDALDVRW